MNVLATTWICSARITTPLGTSQTIYNFDIEFDRNEDPRWFWGSSRTVPVGRPDGKSVATHELGHATGFILHLDFLFDDPKPSYCSGGVTHQTMCEFHEPGTSYQRTLGTHDVHTFEPTY